MSSQAEESNCGHEVFLCCNPTPANRGVTASKAGRLSYYYIHVIKKSQDVCKKSDNLALKLDLTHWNSFVFLNYLNYLIPENPHGDN